MNSTVKIKRANGTIEEKDWKYAVNQDFLNKVYAQNLTHSRSEILCITSTYVKNNIRKLMKEYNDLHNEGGEGYVPTETEYWASLPSYKEQQITEVLMPDTDATTNKYLNMTAQQLGVK
jgi:hypothetical protein